MGPARTTAVAAFAFLFLAQGQRAFLDALLEIASPHQADREPATLALAALPLLALLAPFLPLARLLDRRAAVVLAVAGMAIFRLPLGLESLGARAVGAAGVVACTGLFLTSAVGSMGRRALPLGAVVGLLIDQLLRLAGGGADPTLEAGWLPARFAVSLVVLGLVVWWGRSGQQAQEGDPLRPAESRLERRSGSLRLRAGLGLGALLFLDLHLLSAAPLIARWADLGHGAAALAVALAGAIALGVALAGPDVVRGRGPAVLLAVLAGGGAPVAWVAAGPMAVLAPAAGHGAALLLIARTLDPATGRRGPLTATLALLALVLPGLLYWGSARAPLGAAAALPAVGAWAVGVAALLVLAYAFLAPRPAALPGATGPFRAGLVAAGFLALSSVIIAMGRDASGGAAGGQEPGPTGLPGSRPSARWLRVATAASMPSSVRLPDREALPPRPGRLAGRGAP